MGLHSSSGVLRYNLPTGNYGYRLAVEVDQALVDYYLALIPKYKSATRQRYSAHISVVRREVPTNLAVWGLYQGQEVEFFYENVIREGLTYYWINVFSTRLEEIRTELGLPNTSPYAQPPDGFLKCFHMTIGNNKNG